MPDQKSTFKVAVDARQGRDELGRFTKKTKETTEATKKFDAQLKRSEKQAKRTATSVGQMGAIMRRAFGFIAAGLIGRKVVKTIAGFEQAMFKLQAVTTKYGETAEKTAQRMAVFEQAARELGATTRFSATESGEGLLFLARAGFTTTQSLEAIRPTLNLAIAGMLGFGDAADIASNVVAQFGLATTELEHAGDVLVNTANSSNTTVQQLAEAMKFAGPVAGALGISIEETAAAVGVLGDAGIQASMAGTNMRQVMSKLLKPTAAAEEALFSMGLVVDDVNPAMEDMTTIIGRLEGANLTAADAVDIFGVRNAAAALILTKSIEKFTILEEKNERVNGLMERQAAILKQSLVGQWAQLNSEIEELILKGGDEGITGFLKTIVQGFRDLVKKADENFGDINIQFGRMVDGMLVLWEDIKAGSQKAWEFMKTGFKFAADFMGAVFTNFARLVARELATASKSIAAFVQEQTGVFDIIEENSPLLKALRGVTGVSTQDSFNRSANKIISDNQPINIADAVGPNISAGLDKQDAINRNRDAEVELIDQARFEREQKIFAAAAKRKQLAKDFLDEEEKQKKATIDLIGIEEDINAIRERNMKQEEEQIGLRQTSIDWLRNYSEEARSSSAIVNTAFGGAAASFENFAVAIGTGSKKIKDALRDLANAIQSDVIRILARLALAGVAGAAVDFFSRAPIQADPAASAASRDAANINATGPGQNTLNFGGPTSGGNAHGGNFKVSGPSSGFDVGLRAHGSENISVTPLSDQGSGAGTVINIINQSSGTEVSQNTIDKNTIEVLIKDVVSKDIGSNGAISRTMKSSFGLNTATTVR